MKKLASKQTRLIIRETKVLNSSHSFVLAIFMREPENQFKKRILKRKFHNASNFESSLLHRVRF